MNGYVVMYFDEKRYNSCGNSHTVIIHDLKTVKGVLNRMKNWAKPPKDTKTMVILSYHNWDKYFNDKELYRLENALQYSLYTRNF